MDSLSGCSFENVSEMDPTHQASIEDTLKRLEELWSTMGFNEDEKRERVAIFHSYVNEVLAQLYQEEEQQYKDLIAAIERSKEEVVELCWELGMPPHEFSVDDQDLVPLQMKDLLYSHINTLEKEKTSRENAHKALRETEEPLCIQLDIPPLELSTSTNIPTKQDLVELEDHVRMLKAEKEHRLREYYASKRELTTIMEETEFLPDSSFESDVFFCEDRNMILSQENLRELKELVEKAYNKKCEIEQELGSLKQRLQTLWDRLNVDEHERTVFLTSHSTCKISNICAYQKEIQKCEELKKKNIGMFIEKMRKELVEMWDKCYLSREERENFGYFYSDDFNETLLDIHEEEVQKLQELYKENESIFTKICRRNQLWENMLLFEKKASDPNRFNNRGGQLLQEEKERKRLLTEVPRLETEIFELILQYEQKSGKKFLVNGCDFEKFVEDQRKWHLEEREKEKLERRQRAISEAKTFGNSTNITPAKRLLNTPLKTPSKFRRMNTGMSTLKVPGSTSRTGLSVTPRIFSSRSPKSRSRMTKHTPKTVPRRKAVRNENEAPRPAEADEVNSGKFVASISTYSEFTESLKSQRGGPMNSTQAQIPPETSDLNV